MKQDIVKRGLRATVAILAATGWLGSAMAADLSVATSKSGPQVGESFTVTIHLSNAAPFGVWGAFLKFDPAKLELTAQAAGTFSTFVQDSRLAADINATGEIRAGGYGYSENSGGSGTLGVFTFKALAQGTTQVTAENKSGVNPFGDVLMRSSGSETLPVLPAQPLVITIGDSGADFDLDGIPDASDPDDDNDGMPDAWESSNALNPTNAADAALDPDGDGMSNYDEYRAGTDPADAKSRLQVSDFAEATSDKSGLILRWPGVAGKFYTIQKSTNLMKGFTIPLLTGIPGVDGANSRTVTVDQACGYYRVEVEP